MIASFFISLGATFLGLITGVLPESNLPTEVTTALESVASALNSFSFLIPVTAIFSVVTFVLTFEIMWFAFWGLVWVYKRLPFIGK